MQTFARVAELLIVGDLEEAIKSYSDMAGITLEASREICTCWYHYIREESSQEVAKDYMVREPGDTTSRGVHMKLTSSERDAKHKAGYTTAAAYVATTTRGRDEGDA